MKKASSGLTVLIISLLMFTSCSTQKNTWSTRHYHELNTRYNVHFNGSQAYIQGIKQINKSYKEDYSDFLPVYKVSNHDLAKGTASSMDRAVEKCQTAIKKHSIRVKPKNKPDSKSKEAYKKFYNREEFNPFMKDVFILMANAQFHKADFESAASTCSYIMKHFSFDKPTYDKAAILLARSNIELDWLFDAEKILSDLNNENLTPSLTGSFSAAYADFLLKRKNYADAIPYLKIAIDKSNNKEEKQRWSFLLGQLYQQTGNRSDANKIFGSIPAKNPPYEMEISARIRQTEVYPQNDPAKPLKKLVRLSKSEKNKDYLDQIYYAMGNLYLINKDTVKAKESFHKSIDKSTSGGPHKIKTLVTLGNLYYSMEDFIKAGPCYSDAEVLMNKKDERLKDVSFRNSALKELVPELKIIHDEDSLQALAKLPPKELEEVINKLIKIAKVKAREQSAQEALSANEKLAEGQQNNANGPSTPQIQPSNDKSWYFYNPATVTNGLKEFQRIWGKRTLADDWRRLDKTNPFDQSSTANTDANKISDSTAVKNGNLDADTTAIGNTDNFEEDSDDPLKANYYLKNIPFNEKKVSESNKKISESLYKSGVYFRENMENNRLSLKTFRELEKRFPENENLDNAWFHSYMILKQERRNQEAEIDRKKIIEKFPFGDNAKKLADSLFIENLTEMYQKQDTIYSQTYGYFTENNADSLFSNSSYFKKKYPLSKLIPRVSFMEAIEYGMTGKPEEFHTILDSLVSQYPEHEITPVVKDMLLMWNQGRRPVPSRRFFGNLALDSLNKTDENSQMDSLLAKLKYEPKEEHVLLMWYLPDSTNTNKLLFDVALYNFTTFLVRDYELSIAKIGKMDVLLVQGFEDAEDVLRYRSWISFQNEAPEKKYPGLRMIIASKPNMQLLMQGIDIEKYLDFYKKNYTGKVQDNNKPKK